MRWSRRRAGWCRPTGRRGRRDAAFGFEALGEPELPSLREDGDVVPSVRARDNGAEGDGEDVVEAVNAALCASRVLEVVEVFSDQRRWQRVCRSLRHRI